MENSPEIKKLEIEDNALKDLKITSKWAMFLAIVGFIGVGLLLIIGLFAGVFLSVFSKGDSYPGFPEWLVYVIIVVSSVIYFFPVLYLYRFSRHTANAIKMLSNKELNKAFKNLRAYYVYIGILLIVVLVIYIAGFIVAGASVAFLKDLG